MMCICMTGYQGNGAIKCTPVPICLPGRELILNEDEECVCAPGHDECGNTDSCTNQLCKDPCACGEHAFFRLVEHKPVQPRRGLPLDRVQGGRRLFGHARLSQREVPARVRAGQPAVRRRSHLYCC